jgi:hypothetical protein
LYKVLCYDAKRGRRCRPTCPLFYTKKTRLLTPGLTIYSEEAKQSFLQNPFFASWDPAVLDIYLSCGLTHTTEGSVTLKMPGIQEAVMFAHTRTSFEVWDRLENLDERVELRWVVPGKGDNPG